MPSVKISKRYQSWGRYPKPSHRQVVPVRWRNELPDIEAIEGTVLPFGYGRSYGDSCLNNGGTLLDVSFLNNLLEFDAEKGLIRVEAGVSLAQLVEFLVPRGWFIPVSPGTKYVSVGGAIANDIHGRNHHRAGTFGCHVTRFELVRSSGERLLCSPTENVKIFKATIGGLGLTGLITWAEFTLKKIPSPLIDVERIRFDHIDEFYELDDASKDYEYTVSWVDSTTYGKNLGRGVYMRGEHYDPPLDPNQSNGSWLPKVRVPFNVPSMLLNTFSMKAFNTAYYLKSWQKVTRTIEHYDLYCYPLDKVLDWNRMYGERGLIQYQFVVPDEDRTVIKDIMRDIAKSGESSIVTVLKRFSDVKSPGMLSFPRPGITLALDFANTQNLRQLLDRLDVMVREAGGRIYPAKDARMSAQDFQTFYPNWQEFAQYIDPKFSSSFWRRVTGEN